MSESGGRVRKQWQLQDGPRGTLRRLRRQLAEGGCTESQVAVARALLNEAADNGDDSGNNEAARDAVEWLVKAARRGSTQATPLLRQCIRTGRGLDQNNYQEVLQCLNMTEAEQEARQAAQTLFQEESFDGEPISTGRLFQTLHRLQAGAVKNDSSHDSGFASNRSVDKCSVKFLTGEGKVYTEDELLDLASHVVTGDSPECRMQRELEAEYFDKLTLKEKLFAETGMTLRMTYVQLLEWTTVWGAEAIAFFLVPGYQHLLVLFFLHWAISLETTLVSLPCCVFFITYFVMIVSTVNMLCFRQRLRDLQQWNRLFRLVSEAFTRERSQSLYAWHTLKPYCHFLVAFLLNLFVYPLVPKVLVPSSCFSVISFALSLTTYIALNSCFDYLVIISMVIQILLQLLPRVLLGLSAWDYTGDTLPCAGVYILGRCFRLHVGIPSLLYLIVPILFLSLGARHNFRGFHQLLIPHLVCVAWWQVTMLFLPDSSVYGLLKSLVVFVVLLMLIPLLGIYCAILIGIAVGQIAMQFGAALRVTLFVALIVLPSLVSKWRYDGSPEKETGVFKTFRVMCRILAILSVIYFWLNLSPHTSETPPKVASISWEDYYRYCHKSAWEDAMLMRAEVQCARLVGTSVVWQGDVEMVRVRSVANKLEPVVSMLPGLIREPVKCWLGVPVTAPWLDGESDACDLSNWNLFTFELILLMANKDERANVFVLADQGYHEFLGQLTRGDLVRVRGVLTSGIGGPNPTLVLTAIQCVDCDEDISGMQTGLTFHLNQCVKFLTHFFFSPLLEFYDIWD